MERRKPDYVFSNAITDLHKAGFQVKDEAFGFSVILQDSNTNYHLECGYEHDGNISLSVAGETSVLRWFFRQSMLEMVVFLLMTDELMKSDKVQNWLVALDTVANH